MIEVNHRLLDRSTISYTDVEIIGYMIGDRLKELRQGAEMSQEAFGAIAKTTKQYVGRLENGFNKDPNPKMIEAWAKHFQVRMEWITSGRLPKEAAGGKVSSHPGGLEGATILDPQKMVESLVSIIKVAEKKGRVFKPLEISEALCAIYQVRSEGYPHKMNKSQLKKFDADVESEIDRAWREWDGREEKGGFIQISRKVA